MTKEEFIEAKDAYVENILNYVKQEGEVFPHINIFAKKKNEKEKISFVTIPIPNEYMKNDITKDYFIEEILPEMAKEVNKVFDIFAVSWVSEAWVRKLEKDQNISDYKNLPIKNEILFFNIESDTQNDFIIYNIKREGKQVNNNGEMVDIVILDKEEHLNNEPESFSGRFAGLFKKFKISN